MLFEIIVDSHAVVMSKATFNEQLKAHLLSVLPENSNFPYTTLLLRDFDLEVHLSRLNFLPSSSVSLESFVVGLEVLNTFFKESESVRLMAVNRGGELLLLAESIPEPLLRPRPVCIKIEICSALPRPQPDFKTTAWLQQREELFPVPSGFEEVVLGLEQDGSLLEGLSSNFWVLNDDQVLQTAPFDKVLPGSTSKRLLELEFSIKFACPKVQEMNQWRGAFITSASRFVLPVGAIEFEGKRIEFPENEFIYELRRKLLLHCK